MLRCVLESTLPSTRVISSTVGDQASNFGRNNQLIIVRGLRNMIANMTGKVDDAAISTEKLEETEVKHDLVLGTSSCNNYTCKANRMLFRPVLLSTV